MKEFRPSLKKYNRPNTAQTTDFWHTDWGAKTEPLAQPDLVEIVRLYIDIKAYKSCFVVLIGVVSNFFLPSFSTFRNCYG